MDNALQKQIHVMAQQMWDSAARPYGMALDFWLMAEKMLLEAATTVAKMQNIAMSTPRLPNFTEWPTFAAPVEQTQALAECMRKAAGHQIALGQDYWMAAAKHVFAVQRALESVAGAPDGSKTKQLVNELAALPPQDYLERIRQRAYESWEKAGARYGTPFEHWLKAEQDMLSIFVAASRGAEAGLSESSMPKVSAAPPAAVAKKPRPRAAKKASPKKA